MTYDEWEAQVFDAVREVFGKQATYQFAVQRGHWPGQDGRRWVAFFIGGGLPLGDVLRFATYIRPLVGDDVDAVEIVDDGGMWLEIDFRPEWFVQSDEE